MIIDAMQHSSNYAAVHPRFEAAFAFLKKAVEEQLPVGRYELDGSELYAMVQEYETSDGSKSRLEGHRRYIDIQFLISGTEAVELVEIAGAKEDCPYDEAKDVCFFASDATPTRAVLHAGEYGIFFAHDLHKPGLSVNGEPQKVKKVVVKIKI